MELPYKPQIVGSEITVADDPPAPAPQLVDAPTISSTLPSPSQLLEESPPQVPMTATTVKPPTPASAGKVSNLGTIGGAMATVGTVTKPELNIFQLFWQWLTLNFL